MLNLSTAHHKDFLGPEAAEETTEQQKNVTLRRDFKPSDDEFSTDQFKFKCKTEACIKVNLIGGNTFSLIRTA